MGFYVGRLAASSARKFRLRLYSRSKVTDDVNGLRATPASKSGGNSDDDEDDDEDNEDEDDEESSDHCSNSCSQSNSAFNYTPIPLSLHSDVPLSTCSLDLSKHLGTFPLSVYHPNNTSLARELQFCLNRPHPEHAQVWISSCVGLVIGCYLAAIIIWALFRGLHTKVTQATSSFELALEAVALEIKVPAFVLGPKAGKLVYRSEALILNADEVLKRTLEEYGSIVDDEEIPASRLGNLQTIVHQDINVPGLSRGPLSGGTPLGPNRVLYVSSAPSTALRNPVLPNTPTPTATRVRLGVVYTTTPRPIPVYAPRIPEQSYRPHPVLIRNMAPGMYRDPRWVSMPHTAYPCFSSSPLRQSVLPPSYAPLASPSWLPVVD
ncbi:hypothetical protein FRC08_007263 [Ceratobasidium sp. 394]|nr:hypothetical protein FRC08_007263 [Ceratobasidium sp. 394]KAG9086782.1 hypothetical protein FS749_003382 [Ceratobasidium sp. UAMH 11750]